MECYLALSKHRWLRMAKGYINTVSLPIVKVSLLRVLDTDATRLRYCWKFNKRLRAKDVHGRLFQHISISKNKQPGMVFTTFSVNDIESCWKRSRPVLRYNPPPSRSSPSTPTPSLVSSGCRNRASACKFSWCHLALRPPPPCGWHRSRNNICLFRWRLAASWMLTQKVHQDLSSRTRTQKDCPRPEMNFAVADCDKISRLTRAFWRPSKMAACPGRGLRRGLQNVWASLAAEH